MSETTFAVTGMTCASCARHVEEALERFRAEDFQTGTMMALGDLGDLAADRSDSTRALTMYKAALGLGRAEPAKRMVIEIIESAAIVTARLGEPEGGAFILGAAEGLRERIGLRFRQPHHRVALDQATGVIQAQLSPDLFSAARR